MQGARSRTLHGSTPELRAEALKERVYVTFTALAVCIALERNVEPAGVAGTAATLGSAVVGTLLAVFLADLIAHMTVHSALPSRAQVRHMAAVSLGALLVLVVPMLLLVLAAVDVVTLAWALRAMSFVLVVTLVVVTFLAVHRVRLPAWQKVLAHASIGALGLAVLVLELAVH